MIRPDDMINRALFDNSDIIIQARSPTMNTHLRNRIHVPHNIKVRAEAEKPASSSSRLAAQVTSGPVSGLLQPIPSLQILSYSQPAMQFDMAHQLWHEAPFQPSSPAISVASLSPSDSMSHLGAASDTGRSLLKRHNALSWVENPEFIAFVQELLPQAKVPSQRVLTNRLLPKLTQQFRDQAMRDAIGCNVKGQCDGWSGLNHHHLVAFMVNVDRKVRTVRVYDTSNERKTADNLLKLMLEVIHELEFN
ncbi:hypothetical protein BDP27DRAFT_1432913 [Rhodocollybia butyracea]|uniref:Uncharacterized protein n=1 Tax=Rhodocollybia butyracea TaxID=206335 RepID=A0A9P5TXL0_9AGAR|nr:hypothetical protein BDP27DRAFT_1432913 [Rhodocollybia butyracea]